MIEVNLIGDNNLEVDLVYEILKNRGFDDEKIEEFLNPCERHMEDFYKIINAKEGIETFLKHLKNKSTIAIIQD